MPLKATASSTVYIVVKKNTIDSVHASEASAQERVDEDGDLEIKSHDLVGGSINIDKAPAKKAAAKKTPVSEIIKKNYLFGE